MLSSVRGIVAVLGKSKGTAEKAGGSFPGALPKNLPPLLRRPFALGEIPLPVPAGISDTTAHEKP